MTTFKYKLTLLIIDDDVVFISSLNALFASSFNIEIARDGKSALQSVMLKDIDLVLSAVSTPVISGQELCTFIKNSQLSAHIPVVFLADKVSEDEEEECLAMGAIDYIDKSVRSSILFARLNNLMSMVAQHKKLAEVSCTDGLTGLANRMQLDTTIQQEWYAAIRGNHYFSVLMIDIDHFKLFNDAFGHIEGDRCLKIIAQVIASCERRESDFSARYGGEEFVLLLPFTALKGARQVAQELVDKVCERNIPAASGASFSSVTISIGVATYSPMCQDQKLKNSTQLIEKADKNLFKAKEAGRNQVYID